MRCYIIGIAIGILATILAEYAGLITIVEPGDPCDNSKRFTGKEAIANVQHLSDIEACTRVGRYERINGGQYGAFLSKELIDELFDSNDNNGLWLFLGKDSIREGEMETNIIIKSSKEDFTSTTTERTGYLRIDAMCPTFCDGLDISKCE